MEKVVKAPINPVVIAFLTRGYLLNRVIVKVPISPIKNATKRFTKKVPKVNPERTNIFEKA